MSLKEYDMYIDAVSYNIVSKILSSKDWGAKLLLHHYGLVYFTRNDYIEYVYLKIFLSIMVVKKKKLTDAQNKIFQILREKFLKLTECDYNEELCNERFLVYEKIVAESGDGFELNNESVARKIGMQFFSIFANVCKNRFVVILLKKY